MRNITGVVCACAAIISVLIITFICTIGCMADNSAEQPLLVTETAKGLGREQEPAYTITSVEREMLARLVYREANTESIECQEAIISVVINRWQSGYWGDTLEEVVYAKNQFSPANLLYCTTPNETNYEVVDEVIQNGVTVPEWVMYFRADSHFKWKGYKAYQRIDSTYFGYMEKDKK